MLPRAPRACCSPQHRCCSPSPTRIVCAARWCSRAASRRPSPSCSQTTSRPSSPRPGPSLALPSRSTPRSTHAAQAPAPTAWSSPCYSWWMRPTTSCSSSRRASASPTSPPCPSCASASSRQAAGAPCRWRSPARTRWCSGRRSSASPTSSRPRAWWSSSPTSTRPTSRSSSASVAPRTKSARSPQPVGSRRWRRCPRCPPPSYGARAASTPSSSLPSSPRTQPSSTGPRSPSSTWCSIRWTLSSARRARPRPTTPCPRSVR
mmetsp:Transcript_19418/g.46027  ORF Transcript_19418/g.46027 Transcript_19418/m.46027 type:complete len:262 (+) Transcript_19418:74-859(+)